MLRMSKGASSYGTGVCGSGQTAEGVAARGCIAEGTLPFSGLRLTNVRQKSGMGCTALHEVLAGLVEAELAIDGQPDVLGVVVLLAIVFPPADRAEIQGSGGIECLISTARASITNFVGSTHD